jgi:hypothetical protein
MKTVNNISGTHTLIALGAIAIFAAVVFKFPQIKAFFSSIGGK